VLRDFAIEAELRFDRHVRLMSLRDFNKCEWDAYFAQAGLKTAPSDSYESTKRLIEGDVLAKQSDPGCKLRIDPEAVAAGKSVIAAKLATNLDFLNLIVEQVQQIKQDKVSDFYLCGEMVSRIMERDKKLETEENIKTAFTHLENLALKASLANTRDLEIDGRISHDALHALAGVPLFSVRDGRFVFNPELVHSYFAVRGLNRALDDVAKRDPQQKSAELTVFDPKPWNGKPMPITLLKDVAVFSPLPPELEPVSQFIACEKAKKFDLYSQTSNADKLRVINQILGNGAVSCKAQ
jgi:hypothetical protein